MKKIFKIILLYDLTQECHENYCRFNQTIKSRLIRFLSPQALNDTDGPNLPTPTTSSARDSGGKRRRQRRHGLTAREPERHTPGPAGGALRGGRGLRHHEAAGSGRKLVHHGLVDVRRSRIVVAVVVPAPEVGPGRDCQPAVCGGQARRGGGRRRRRRGRPGSSRLLHISESRV